MAAEPLKPFRNAPSIDDVTALGRELKRLGFKQVAEVRELWRRWERGDQTKSDIERVEFLERLVGLGLDPFVYAEHCPGCAKRGTGKDWSRVRVVYNFPDRHLAECAGCGKQWLSSQKGDVK